MTKDEFLDFYKKDGFEPFQSCGFIGEIEINIVVGSFADSDLPYMAFVSSDDEIKPQYFNTLEELLYGFEINGKKFIDQIEQLYDFTAISS